MAKLTIHGSAQSRAARCMWMARELGLDFDVHEVAPTNANTPEFRKINPNGRVPAVTDGDLTLFESLAINLYLARKHGGPLQPTTLQDEALATQWSLWAATEIEKPAVRMLLEGRKAEAERDPKVYESGRAEVERPLAVLEGHLADRSYLLGPSFTVADLNVAMVVAALPRGGTDLTAWPKVKAWLERCLSRPALKG